MVYNKLLDVTLIFHSILTPLGLPFQLVDFT